MLPLTDQEQNIVQAWFKPEVQHVLSLMPSMTRIIISTMNTCVVEAFGGRDAFNAMVEQTLSRLGDEIDEFTRNISSDGDK